MPLGIKTGPTPGVTSVNQRNKDVEFICGENDSGELSRAIMALLLEILWEKKCQNLSGGEGYFPITVYIFPMPKIWNYFFCSTTFVDKIIIGNITYKLLYQLVVIVGK